MQDVKALGRKGDVKEVADGYARNYLIPKGMALEGNEANLRKLSEAKRAAKATELREEEEARAIAARLDGLNVVIKAKTGESGRLFGSVTAKDIAEAVERSTRIELDRKKIELPEGLKHLGEYQIPVRLYHGVIARLNLTIVEGE